MAKDDMKNPCHTSVTRQDVGCSILKNSLLCRLFILAPLTCQYQIINDNKARIISLIYNGCKDKPFFLYY